MRSCCCNATFGKMSHTRLVSGFRTSAGPASEFKSVLSDGVADTLCLPYQSTERNGAHNISQKPPRARFTGCARLIGCAGHQNTTLAAQRPQQSHALCCNAVQGLSRQLRARNTGLSGDGTAPYGTRRHHCARSMARGARASAGPQECRNQVLVGFISTPRTVCHYEQSPTGVGQGARH